MVVATSAGQLYLFITKTDELQAESGVEVVRIVDGNAVCQEMEAVRFRVFQPYPHGLSDSAPDGFVFDYTSDSLPDGVSVTRDGDTYTISGSYELERDGKSWFYGWNALKITCGASHTVDMRIAVCNGFVLRVQGTVDGEYLYQYARVGPVMA